MHHYHDHDYWFSFMDLYAEFYLVQRTRVVPPNFATVYAPSLVGFTSRVATTFAVDGISEVSLLPILGEDAFDC